MRRISYNNFEINDFLGIFEENETSQIYNPTDSSILEIQSLKETIGEILEDLIKNAEKVNETKEPLVVRKSDVSISSNEFFDRILPDDILSIVRKIQIPSHSASSESVQIEMNEKLSESPNLEQIFHSKVLYQTSNYFNENSSQFSLENDFSMNLKQSQDEGSINVPSVSTSTVNPSSDIMAKPGIPKELLPVFEKQGSKRSLFYSSATSTISRKTVTDQKITEISKPITKEYSVLNIDDVEKGMGSSYWKNDNAALVSSTEFGTIDIPKKFSPLKTLTPAKVGDPTVINAMNQKSRTASLLTLKSLIRNFVSSSSSENLSAFASGSEKSSTSISNKLKKYFVAKNIKTSSDSISGNELFKEEENKIDEIITIAKPQQIFSSGSLTSENLGADESIYYLAETDSDKTFM